MNRATHYLDHNAGSPLRASARAALQQAWDMVGNASSVHAPGRAVRALVERAREDVARFVGADSGAVVFTSSGSEANAMALRGAIAAANAAEDRKTQKRITRLFVSTIEHDSVRANALAMADTMPGLKLYEIPVTKDGVVDVAAFRLQYIGGKGRALVAVMAANNETGAVQPIEAIAKVVRAEGEDSLVLVDAVASAGRLPLAFAASNIDYLTLSAHKLGGPQGAGALVIKDHAPFASLIAGGGQEKNRRAGTENVAAIAGFGEAVKEAVDIDASNERLGALRDRFETTLKALAPQTVIFAAAATRLANTSNFAIPGLSAETALIALDLDGVAISSGAACSSGKVAASHVLAAMGVNEDLARCGLRLSLGWSSTQDDINAVLASLARLLARKANLAA